MENKYNFNQLKKFIEKEGIKSRSEFSAKFERVYKKSFLPLTEEEKTLLLPSLNPNYYGFLKTKDDFKLFFEENRILSRSDLNRRFKNCYDRFMTILTKEEQSEILPTLQSYVYIKTKDDLKRFIVDNNIKSRRQLSKKFSGVAARFYRNFNKRGKR